MVRFLAGGTGSTGEVGLSPRQVLYFTSGKVCVVSEILQENLHGLSHLFTEGF